MSHLYDGYVQALRLGEMWHIPSLRCYNIYLNTCNYLEPYRLVHKKDKKPQSHYIERPWQALYDKRLDNPPIPGPRQELSPANYRKQFYDTLWYEEKEHSKKLDKK